MPEVPCTNKRRRVDVNQKNQRNATGKSHNRNIDPHMMENTEFGDSNERTTISEEESEEEEEEQTGLKRQRKIAHPEALEHEQYQVCYGSENR
ncbi:hypothetical protein KEM56_003211 [Ascosphaera pollenicola]|nr:hypothetical protein KEM56_003211 [Ascosphaera pollenicola]